MNQTKEETSRRLAVPVLTIAVCAMAMIGFGFALTTDVTSESDVGVFQVDLSDDYATISAAKSVANETSVNKVFDGYVQSSKAGNGTVTYSLIGAEAYLKVFGDSGANVVLKMTTTDSTYKYVVSLYTTDGTTDTPVQEGVVAGGGTAPINAIPAVRELCDSLEGDERTGAKIVLKALEAPLRQIAKNAGLEGSVIIDKIISANKPNYGFDAQNEVYVDDMIAAGIVDPTKVTRSALENAASVAEMVLTTESLVADLPEPPAPAAPAGDMGGMGGMY